MFINIVRDQSIVSNCITIDSTTGLPLINYQPTPTDLTTMMEGLKVSLKLMYAGKLKTN